METEKQISSKPIIALIGLSVLAVYFFMKSCEKPTDTVKVTLPAQSGSFAPVKPGHEPLFPTYVSRPSSRRRENDNVDSSANNVDSYGINVDSLLAENERLKQDFAKASDSLKAVIYAKSIQLNEFCQDFEDTVIKATASGIVRGEVQSLKLDYTIKPRTLESDTKQKRRILGGLEVGNSLQFDKANVKVGLGFQNRKGSVFSASYDTGNRVYLGYHTALFNF